MGGKGQGKDEWREGRKIKNKKGKEEETKERRGRSEVRIVRKRHVKVFKVGVFGKGSVCGCLTTWENQG